MASLVQTYHGVVRGSGISHASGGSLLSTRFKVSSEQNAFFASHSQLYHVSVPDIPEADVQWTRGRQGENISLQVPLGELSANPLMSNLHRHELQSIDTTSVGGLVRVASIDAVGLTSLTTVDTQTLQITSQHILGEAQPRESGWAGVALHASLDKVWSTTFWDKSLQLFEEGKLVRTVHCCLTPQAIEYVEMQSVVALAESNVVSLWDLRTSERSGCVSRLQPSASNLYCIDSRGDLMAVAGEDKTIYIYDLRKNKIMGQWTKALKYQVLSVFLSSIDPAVCYTTGLDHEIFCGTWEKNAGANPGTLERRGFRGSSRWIGLDRVSGTDTLIGLTDTLQLYKLRHPFRLNPACAVLPLPRETQPPKRQKKRPSED